jgi:carbon storage regulator
MATMLVLSRKKDQSVIIDGGIKIKVIGVRGDLVRLGIEAPREVGVYRTEVLARIQTESLASDVCLSGIGG